MPAKKLRPGKISAVKQHLFPSYLFIRSGQGPLAQSWTPIPLTKSVNRVVTFGNTPAKVVEAFITLLHGQEKLVQAEPDRLFKVSEQVHITSGAFKDIEGIDQMTDGEQRVMVLIELIGKPIKIMVPPFTLKKVT